MRDGLDKYTIVRPERIAIVSACTFQYNTYTTVPTKQTLNPSRSSKNQEGATVPVKMLMRVIILCLSSGEALQRDWN